MYTNVEQSPRAAKNKTKQNINQYRTPVVWGILIYLYSICKGITISSGVHRK